MAIKRKTKNEFVVNVDSDFLPVRSRYNPLLTEMREWCTSMFGPGGRNKIYVWRYGWTDTTNNFYFKRKQDAIFFSIRWL